MPTNSRRSGPTRLSSRRWCHYCVAKAELDTEQVTLAKFRAEQSSYSRNDLVTKAGWATLGCGKFPDNALARACSEKLQAMKSG